MKLKRIMAGILTSVMVVASVPVAGLDAVMAYAETTDDGDDGLTSQTPLGIYRYKAIADGLEASSDGAYRQGAGVDVLTASDSRYALSRHNTGKMAISSELVSKNNIYFSLQSASAVSDFVWWTTNMDGRYYGSGNVNEGAVLCCKLYVLSENVANTAEAMGAHNWGEGKLVEFDSNVNDMPENNYNRVGFKAELDKLFGDTAKSIKSIRMEVLNTAGDYTSSGGTVTDNCDTSIEGLAVELFDQSESAEKIEGWDVCADFATGAGRGVDQLKSVGGSHAPGDNSGDLRMQSKKGDAQSPVKEKYETMVDNNNLYFTLKDDKKQDIVPRTIGRLTYLSGTVYGSIGQVRIYTSNNAQIQYEPEKTLKDLDDWTLVYSNVPGEQKGKDEYLGADGTVQYREGAEIPVWGPYTATPTAWENAHTVVFDKAQEARYVRMEVLTTSNTTGRPLTNLPNKWISGNSVYIYEAEPVYSYGDVNKIDLRMVTPTMNTTLGRVDVLNKTSAYLNGNSWKWLNYETREELKGQSALKAIANQRYTLQVTLSVKSPDKFTDQVEVRLKDCMNDSDIDTAPWVDADRLIVTKGETKDGVSEIMVEYSPDQVEDITRQWQALKDYVAQVKPLYDTNNKWGENEEGKPDDDVNADKYTTRAWNEFKKVFEEASSWTESQTLPDVGGNGKPSEGEGGAAEPSGRHKASEYEAKKAELQKLYENMSKAIITGRTPLEEDDDIKITVTPPVDGASPEDAKVANAGGTMSSSTLSLAYRDGAHVADDDFFYGKSSTDSEGNEVFGGASVGIAVADHSVSNNAALAFDGPTKFMIHFKMKLAEEPTTKQSIVGNLNEGYGVQLVPKSGSKKAQILGYAAFKGDNGGSKWPEVSIELPDDFYKDSSNNVKEHDIIFAYDGSKLILYVDGQKHVNDREITGELKRDQNADFAVGYNPHTPNGSGQTQLNKAGEYFKGGFKDFELYAATTSNDVQYEVPAFEELEELSKKTDSGANWTPDAFMAKLEEILTGKKPLLKLRPKTTKYQVHSTVWRGIRDEEGRYPLIETLHENSVFSDYMPYEVEVVITVPHPHSFRTTDEDGNPIKYGALLQDASGAAFENQGEGVLGDHDTEIVVKHRFEAKQEHPRDTLRKYIMEDLVEKIVTTDGASAVNVNETSAGVRVYTKATWNAYILAYEKATKLAADRKDYGEDAFNAYAKADQDLKDAVEGLKLSADTCECTIVSISGFEPSGEETVLDMGDKTSLDYDLSGFDITIEGSKGDGFGAAGTGCIMHKDTAEEDMTSYEYTVPEVTDPLNSANATIEGQTLTVTKRGSVDVTLNAKYGDSAMEKKVTFSVTGTPATPEQKEELGNLLDQIKGEYTEQGTYSDDAWQALQDAIQKAEDCMNDANAIVGDVNAAKKDLQDAIEALEEEKKNQDAETKLNQAIQDAEKYLGQESKYTADSWSKFMAAYNAAKNNTDPDKRAQLADALLSAIAGLKENSPGGNTPGGNTPGGNTPGGNTPGGSTPGGNTGNNNQSSIFVDGYEETVKGITYKVKSAAKAEVEVTKGKDAKSCVIPATVTVGGVSCKVVGIAKGAFNKCKKLVNVTIGANVTKIAKNAFNNCKKLKKITFKSKKKLPSMKKAFSKIKPNTVKVEKALKKSAKIKKKTIKQLKAAGLKVKSVK